MRVALMVLQRRQLLGWAASGAVTACVGDAPHPEAGTFARASRGEQRRARGAVSARVRGGAPTDDGVPSPAGTSLPAAPSPAAAGATEAVFPLFARHPALEAVVPRAALGAWPTPLTPLDALAGELGLGGLVVKRDDLSATPYGGGKPRKLELLLGAALAAGHRGVVTFGGVGSHHAAATAIYAHKLGLACRLFLLPQPPTDEVRRVLLTCARHGAELELVGSLAAGEARARHLASDHTLIAAGGSSVVGNLGFVNAAFELAAQLDATGGAVPAVVVTAVGTMGSAVGLAVGLEALGWPTRIVGVRTASWAAASTAKGARLFADTVSWLRARDGSFPAVTLSKGRLRLEDRFLGEGYALPTAAGDAATTRAREEGLRLDATYTAKAFAALLAVPRREPKTYAGNEVLFWHTHSHAPLSDEGDASLLPTSLRGYAKG